MTGRDELARRVEEVPYWYHTFDFGGGVVTDGHYDLRGIVDKLPWPDLEGKRCLDVATFDGFYAFEMERRGAAEVVAIDLDDFVELDWLPRTIPPDLKRGDLPVGVGFRLAHEHFGSSVKRLNCNVYDLDPDEIGTFDFVNCGALMQHLRDPLRALEAIRDVCAGTLQSIEWIRASMTLLHPRKPLMTLMGSQQSWMVPNASGHRKMLEMTGWDIDRSDRLSMPLGGRVAASTRPRWHRAVRRSLWRLLGGQSEPPFSVLLAQPSPNLAALPRRPR